VVRRPQIVLVIVALASVAPALALAEPRGKRDPKPDKTDSKKDDSKKTDPKKKEPKVFDFTGIQFEGRLRTPQLLYFLDRAAEELERASLERRSFIPEMVRSIDEEPL